MLDVSGAVQSKRYGKFSYDALFDLHGESQTNVNARLTFLWCHTRVATLSTRMAFARSVVVKRGSMLVWLRASFARPPIFVFTLFLCLVWCSPSSAAGTGQITGVVTDINGAPVAAASIDIRSPGDHYTTKSDASGRFALAGLTVDTYTISTTKAGFNTFVIGGATISQDETYRVTIKLGVQLRTIGRTRARPITSAFQPEQTIDRTVVNAQGIDQLLGKSFDTNGKQLLSELPGVAIDKNGTVLIRGGTSFEGALEVEGIDYTEPNRSLSNRFENVGNGYLLNGVGSIEIIPGGGDATHGNTGTGLIALTAKRGTSPSFFTVDLEKGTLGGANPSNQFGFEYGFTALKNKLSNYTTFIAEDQHYFYGPYGTDPAGIIADPSSINPDLQGLSTADQRTLYTTSVFNQSFQSSRNFLNNLVYKFGRDQSEQLQFFLQSQVIHQNLDYGGPQLLTAVPQDIGNQLLYGPRNFNQSLEFLTYGSDPVGLPAGQLNNASVTDFLNRFAPRVIGAAPGATLQSPETIDSPFSAYKIEYDNNLTPTTSLQFRAYRTDDAASEALPSQGLFVPQEGGIRRGLASDITKVLSDKHTVRIGGKYDFSEPFGSRINTNDYTGIFGGLYNFFGQALQYSNLGANTHDIIADFLQPQPVVIDPVGGSVLSGTPGCIGLTPPGQPPVFSAPPEHCGYLYHYFPNGPPPLPAEVEAPLARQQSYGLYAQDTYAPNTRLRILAGLRLDGYNFLLPGDVGNPPAVDGIRHQRLYEPKLGLSYRIGNRDAVRANFGRSLSIPLPSFLGNDIDRSSLAAFAKIPSYDSVTGLPATYCGLPSLIAIPYQPSVYLGSQPCKSYADQLYWLLRDARFGGQSQITSPLRGATFTNYDFTYSHEFNGGSAVKITPFYRRGYDVVETSQTLLGIDPTSGTQQLSPEIQSNLGFQTAAGFEFVATTPQRPTGLSATVTATYVNQIGNDPPGNYLPTASIQLGEVYHSPTIAPMQATFAATYRTKWGLRINPILTFKSGYPYGSGIYQALTINGKPYYIPYTNAVYQGFFSSLLSNGSVDPQYPGTVLNPNIVATRGTEPLTSTAGSLFSSPFVNLDLTISMTPPPGKNGLTYGLAITNFFDRTSSVPYPNYANDCVLVYTGLCAASGFAAVSDATHTAPQTANSIYNPYLVYINQQPIAIRFFVQAHL